MKQIIKAKGIVRGEAKGEAIVFKHAFSFLGDVDMDSGVIIAKGHEHEGVCISGKIMIYPETKGSSGGCVVLMVLAKLLKSPAALVILKPADTNIVEGAIIAHLPLLCEPQGNLISTIKTGTIVTVNGESGIIEVEE